MSHTSLTVLVPRCPTERAKGASPSQVLIVGSSLPVSSPVWGGQVLLLLELLLQAHELQLSEDGPTPAWFLLPVSELLRL